MHHHQIFDQPEDAAGSGGITAYNKHPYDTYTQGDNNCCEMLSSGQQQLLRNLDSNSVVTAGEVGGASESYQPQMEVAGGGASSLVGGASSSVVGGGATEVGGGATPNSSATTENLMLYAPNATEPGGAPRLNPENYMSHTTHRRHGRTTVSYACPFCSKDFSDRFKWNRHLRAHTGEKPYVCRVCNKRYTRKDKLKDHCRIHHGRWEEGAGHDDLV